jgi:hypothetical protein
VLLLELSAREGTQAGKPKHTYPVESSVTITQSTDSETRLSARVVPVETATISDVTTSEEDLPTGASAAVMVTIDHGPATELIDRLWASVANNGTVYLDVTRRDGTTTSLDIGRHGRIDDIA